jgi:transmembrane sensor
VRQTGAGVGVSVERGTVRVSWRRHDLTLNAGESTRFGEQGEALPALRLDPAEIAWQSGRLVFNGAPLRSVLEEMDRYWPGRIVLLDDAAGARPVSASLWLNDLDSGLDALAATQNVRITRLTRYLVVVSDAGG